ncbi:MAG: serine--tRNA ligase, partial [Bacteroidetes bacterium]
MLQINNIREHKDVYITALAKRGMDAKEALEDVLTTDETRRATQAQLDEILSQSNIFSKEIGLLIKNGEVQKANLLKEKTGQLKEQSKTLQSTLNDTVEKLQQLLYDIPNIPD